MYVHIIVCTRVYVCVCMCGWVCICNVLFYPFIHGILVLLEYTYIRMHTYMLESAYILYGDEKERWQWTVVECHQSYKVLKPIRFNYCNIYRGRLNIRVFIARRLEKSSRLKYMSFRLKPGDQSRRTKDAYVVETVSIRDLKASFIIISIIIMHWDNSQ